MLRLVYHYKKVMFFQIMLLFCSVVAFAQFKVRFMLLEAPAYHLPDSIFVSGNFNGWNPGKNGIFFSKTADTAFIELNDLPAGAHQFKFTRGSWQTVECMAGGVGMPNRVMHISGDTTILVSIEAWEDDFSTREKHHTTSPNVQIIDTAFEMPQLGRTRRIWLYLPPGYSKSRKRYPVMYMQDGQNVFDDYTSAYGEWRVDESADSLVRNGKPSCIIVGIDNGPQRANEYNPFDFERFGKGEGDQYVNFIVENLKPFIDKHYRTLPTPDNTIIAGSSMGGLIAYYALLKYPKVFGKGGIFSPSFWMAEKIKMLTDSSGKTLKGSLFFYIGGQEGERAISEMQEVTEKLGKNSIALIYAVTDPVGKHNEQAWRKWFPEFYKWALASGFNNVIELDVD